jgi:hypothetical protein
MGGIHGKSDNEYLHTIRCIQQYALRYKLFLKIFSFGFVVEGADFLSDMKEGDVIVSAKVTEGLEYLLQPK